MLETMLYRKRRQTKLLRRMTLKENIQMFILLKRNQWKSMLIKIMI